jgi:hypothetical protein
MTAAYHGANAAPVRSGDAPEATRPAFRRPASPLHQKGKSPLPPRRACPPIAPHHACELAMKGLKR